VTVGDFRQFVDETGYVTIAERRPAARDYTDALSSLLVPGSAVFRPTDGPVDLDSLIWWHYVPDASWHCPEGPESVAIDDHPVTHIAYDDAAAYAVWASQTLPSEAEWERAARGGLDGARFAWGNEETPNGRLLANTWQGDFPWRNLALDGYAGTSPVGSFPPNGYGVYDMIGNVWEWTSDAFDAPHKRAPASPCCAPAASAGPRFTTRVIKGGSFAPPTIACASVRRPGSLRPSIRRPHTSDSAASDMHSR
jgi:formylglycine-generating enzyme